jgi:hypothetical protein
LKIEVNKKMKLTTRGRRLVSALYIGVIISLVYIIFNTSEKCIKQDLAQFIAYNYHYGNSQEIEHAREIYASYKIKKYTGFYKTRFRPIF